MKREAGFAKTTGRRLWIAVIAIGLVACGLVARPAIAGGVVAWGRNDHGECNVPAGLTGAIAVAAGGEETVAANGHSLAVKSDGTVVAWGSNVDGQSSVPADLTGVVAVSAGRSHSLALKSDGTIAAWGLNLQGQCNVPPLPAGVTYTAISAGYYRDLALRSDGTAVGWGMSGGTINVPALPAGVTYTAVAAGGGIGLAIRSDGQVIRWGYNFHIPVTPDGLTGVTDAVSVGWRHCLALKSDGTVVAWGWNGLGQCNVPALPDGVTYTAISANGFHSMAIRSDGTVVAWGNNSHGQATPPPDLVGVTAIAAGSFHSLAVASVNEPPTIESISAPVDPVAVDAAVNVSAQFIDPNAADTHTATWMWGDESTSAGTVNQATRSVSGSHSYTEPGVYTLRLTVTDDGGESHTLACPSYVVVYDPSAGFVTGGGWITSPPGAYINGPTLVGKANFGFTAKYHQGAECPSGQTEFRFRMADLEFHSTDYQWLVVAGARAKFKGRGTLDGTGNYAFMVTAIDGQLDGGGGTDKFRIKIWDPETEEVIYDNQRDADDDSDAATALGGGSIVIHKKK